MDTLKNKQFSKTSKSHLGWSNKGAYPVITQDDQTNTIGALPARGEREKELYSYFLSEIIYWPEIIKKQCTSKMKKFLGKLWMEKRRISRTEGEHPAVGGGELSKISLFCYFPAGRTCKRPSEYDYCSQQEATLWANYLICLVKIFNFNFGSFFHLRWCFGGQNFVSTNLFPNFKPILFHVSNSVFLFIFYYYFINKILEI